MSTEHDAAKAPVKPGDVLAGKYRVERVLGVGGMGVVVAAQHVQLGQHVALKFLHGVATQDPNAVARFLREARAVVQIQSEHVARVSDVGTLETGSPYIVMEFLKGTDLDQVLAQRGPLPIDEAVDHVLQACEAIAEAHKLGIVHRDLKPANLFLTRRPDGGPLVKVLDFGISKLESDTMQGAALTATSSLFGSPLYMSPEQMRSAKKVDHRTDIWSLGIILHELLTASRAFDADTLPALCTAIAMEPPARLREKLPHAPEALEVALLRCLEKDPNRRFANVADLAEAIAPFSPHGFASAERVRRILGVKATALASDAPPPGRPITSPAFVPGTGAPGSGTAQSWSGTGPAPTTTSSSRSRAPIALLAALVLGGAIVASVFALRTRGQGASAEPNGAPPAPAASAVASTIAVPASAAPAIPAPPPSASAAPEVASSAPVASAPIASASKKEAPPPVRTPRAASPRAPTAPVASAPAPAPANPQGASPRDGYSDRK